MIRLIKFYIIINMIININTIITLLRRFPVSCGDPTKRCAEGSQPKRAWHG